MQIQTRKMKGLRNIRTTTGFQRIVENLVAGGFSAGIEPVGPAELTTILTGRFARPAVRPSLPWWT